MKKRRQRNYLKAMEQFAKECGCESFSVGVNDPNDREIRQIFFGEDCEKITAGLVAELAKEGMNCDDLRFFIREGFRYCRPRKSFLRVDLREGAVYEVTGSDVHIHSLIF